MANPQAVLIIGFVWPEPDSSAAGSRMIQILSLFLEQGWKVTFASAASDTDYMSNLEQFGIIRKSINLNSDDFDVFISELNPSIVLFDRFMTEEQFGWRVAKHCPDALRLLDTEDLHCLRLARQKAVKENREFVVFDLFAEDVAKREIASIFRSDISLMISEFEMRLLQEIFGIDRSLLHYMPLFSGQIEVSGLPSFENRNDFAFIGNFLHEPNKDAVFYLKQRIWPAIHQQLPEVSLHIYGAYPPQSILQLNNPKERFYVHGRAKSASDIVKNARAVLAPLRFGAGIKGKLFEAMQCGTPSITSTIGAEAMHGDLPWNGFVSDDPEEFANAAVALYQDKSLWQKVQNYGFEIINNRYLETLFQADFINKILDVQKNLQIHRTNNFTGAMLLHHSMRSTEYLSRWIEAKNKG
ncbi:MAG TPA: glycosyltransferase [Flavobacterium sp.]|nr:glycosyltransferase [Flavobacterium sp.]